MAENLFAKIVNQELGLNVPEWRDYTISSPFRSDSNPSFRIYVPKDENDLGSAYDFGTGKAYTPVTFIMELKGMTYNEAIEYIYSNYGVQLSNTIVKKDSYTTELIKLIKAFNKKISPLLIEKLILASFNNDRKFINKFLINYLPSPILL